MTSRRLLAAATLVALAMGAAGLVAWRGTGAPAPAPAVAYTLLDGRAGSTGDLRGKVVLVNFWATSCTTCVAEMPRLVETHRKYHPRGLETLAVSMQYDPPAYVIRYAEAKRLPFGVAIDHTGEIARRFGDVALTPTSVLINRRGEVVKRYTGTPDFAELHRLVEKLLDEA